MPWSNPNSPRAAGSAEVLKIDTNSTILVLSSLFRFSFTYGLIWLPSGHHAALRDQRREADHVFGDCLHDLIGKTRVIEAFERVVQKTVPQQRMAQKQRARTGCDLQGRLGHCDSLKTQRV